MVPMTRQQTKPEAGRDAALPRVFDETTVRHPAGVGGRYRRVVGEFWTARQKQMDPLHYVISYRASFKPELPGYFIERLTEPGQIVYDPFSGRGTTALQANLMGRAAAASDVNPLAVRMTAAKCRPVTVEAIEHRLAEVDWDARADLSGEPVEDLEPFYHPDTLRQLLNLRAFLRRDRADDVDAFIELLAISRLHGHSDGFLSVYSFPQISVPPNGQRRINRKRHQQPEFRPVAERIIRKARRSLRGMDIDAIRHVSQANRVFVAGADAIPPADLPDGSVDLIVTSPPFLAKADYLADNWLEFWFAGIDPVAEGLESTLVQTRNLDRWRQFIGGSMACMARVLRPGGHAVIEVGEVEHEGQLLHLDEVIVELAEEVLSNECRVSRERDVRAASGNSRPRGNVPVGTRTNALSVVEVMIHTQQFTKLANCFNVSNNTKGTNTHRLVVLRRK